MSQKTEDADLSGAEFINTNLSGARFDDVNLSDAKFININLRGTTFEDVALAGVVIRNANCTGLTIEDACYEHRRIDGILVTDLLTAYRKHPEQGS